MQKRSIVRAALLAGDETRQHFDLPIDGPAKPHGPAQTHALRGHINAFDLSDGVYGLLRDEQDGFFADGNGQPPEHPGVHTFRARPRHLDLERAAGGLGLWNNLAHRAGAGVVEGVDLDRHLPAHREVARQ